MLKSTHWNVIRTVAATTSCVFTTPKATDNLSSRWKVSNQQQTWTIETCDNEIGFHSERDEQDFQLRVLSLLDLNHAPTFLSSQFLPYT